MSLSIQLYKDLLAIGTNITIKSGVDRESLKELANIANKSNVLLNVKVDSCISIDELKELAKIGQKNINIEFI